MVGKLTSHGIYYHRRYFCHRALTSRLMCDHRNSHRADELEKMVLDKLGEFADKKRTLELLAGMETVPGNKDLEPDRLKKDLKACEREFELHLRLLKEGQISEVQFSVANEPVRKRHEGLLQKSRELENSVKQEKGLKSWHRTLADLLTTFPQDFKSLPLAQQKAKLIEVIREIRVYKDRSTEVYLRENPLAMP